MTTNINTIFMGSEFILLEKKCKAAHAKKITMKTTDTRCLSELYVNNITEI